MSLAAKTTREAQNHPLGRTYLDNTGCHPCGVVILTPNTNRTGEAVHWLSSFFLVTYGIAVLGLVIGWRWELAGGLITIITPGDARYFVYHYGWHLVENILFVGFHPCPPQFCFYSLGVWRKSP